MAIILLTARREAPGSPLVRFRVHLDHTKKDAGTGDPDPAFVREWVFSTQPPAGATPAEYRAQLRRELKALAQSELDRLGTGGAGVAGFTDGETL